MYKLIGNRQSRTNRVIWALEELGEPYELVEGAPQSDAVKKYSPLGKIPVLLDGDHIIPDSVAIMMHLANKHGKIASAPGTPERAKEDAMTMRIVDEVDALLWMAARHSFILPAEHRVPEVKESLKWEFARNMDLIAEEMGDGPYLCGEKFTIADIVLTHCGGWAISAKFPKTENEKFAAYFRRTVSRDAYKRMRADS